jgi:F-type H+-transporting ATPase subunit c
MIPTTTIEVIALYQTKMVLSATLLLAIPAFGGALAIAILSSKLLESIARQPELNNTLFTRAVVFAGMIDGLCILSMSMGIVLIWSNPLYTTLEKFITV